MSFSSSRISATTSKIEWWQSSSGTDASDLAEVTGALGAALPSVDLFLEGLLASIPGSCSESRTSRRRPLGVVGFSGCLLVSDLIFLSGGGVEGGFGIAGRSSLGGSTGSACRCGIAFTGTGCEGADADDAASASSVFTPFLSLLFADSSRDTSE